MKTDMKKLFEEYEHALDVHQKLLKKQEEKIKNRRGVFNCAESENDYLLCNVLFEERNELLEKVRELSEYKS